MPLRAAPGLALCQTGGHIGVDAESGEIVAIDLTRKDVGDAARTEALLDQITGPLTSFTAGGAYDQDRLYDTVTGGPK